jgi:hypothetical protein
VDRSLVDIERGVVDGRVTEPLVRRRDPLLTAEEGVQTPPAGEHTRAVIDYYIRYLDEVYLEHMTRIVDAAARAGGARDARGGPHVLRQGGG